MPIIESSSLKGLLTNLALIIFSLVISLAAGEFYFRTLGHAPGFIPRYGTESLRPLEKLDISENYYTDAEGIFKANPDGDWESAFQINTDGFRSIPFKRYSDGKPSILLLGDSFAWGATAKPITNSFADILSNSGYRVFNTGIPAAEPPQYAYLAGKYAHIVKPDVIVVAFYMGNDICKPSPMLPHKNLFHVTNAGWLYAFDNEHHMTADEAYKFYLAKGNEAHAYMNDQRNTLKAKIKRLMMTTAIGTNIWVRLSEAKLHAPPSAIDNPPEKDTNIYSREILDSARDSLLRIKEIAEHEDAELMLFIIPVNPDLDSPKNSIEANRSIFTGLNPLIPHNLNRADYRELPDDHFNNQGHRKFADFILESLRQAGIHPDG